jgi:hypothetical protein
VIKAPARGIDRNRRFRPGQAPIPTRRTDLSSTWLRDLPAGYESHLTPLAHARRCVDEPEPVGRLGTDALAPLVCGQTLADRLMAMRWVAAAEALPHEASGVHVATALGPQTAELGSRADGQQQHGDRRRQVIEEWALGSTRAERLRGIVIDEAALDPLPREVTGHPPRLARTAGHAEDRGADTQIRYG